MTEDKIWLRQHSPHDTFLDNTRQHLDILRWLSFMWPWLKVTQTDGNSWGVCVWSCWSCCAISETKWTGNVSETTVGGFFFFTVVPPLFTCHLTPRWKQNMGMFGVSACMAVCVGIVQWTAAKVISCLPRPLFPASCWQGTHGRGINEISRLLLPLPSVNLCPLLVRSAALQAFSG